MILKEHELGCCDIDPGLGDLFAVFRPHRRVRQALTLEEQGSDPMLYLTALLSVAALAYLTYAMIRPESF